MWGRLAIVTWALVTLCAPARLARAQDPERPLEDEIAANIKARGLGWDTGTIDRNLRVTAIKLPPVAMEKGDWELLLRFPSLTSLDLTSVQADSVRAADFDRIGSLKNLELLKVAGLPIGARGAEAIARLTKLKVLDLGQTRMTDSAAQKLSGLASLEGVSLAGTRVTSKGLAALPKARLHLLYADGLAIRPGELPAAEFPRLELLTLASATVDGELPSMPALKFLDLRLATITPRGFDAMTSLKRGRRLDLDLGGVAMRTEDLKPLGMITNLSWLHLPDEDRKMLDLHEGAKHLSALKDTRWAGKALGLFDVVDREVLADPDGDSKEVERRTLERSSLAYSRDRKEERAKVAEERRWALDKWLRGDLEAELGNRSARPNFAVGNVARPRHGEESALFRYLTGRRSARPIEHLAGNETVRTLDLRAFTVTDSDLVQVARLPNLEALGLSYQAKITGAGLKHLAGLKKLRYLKIDGCPEIGDEDLKALAGIASLDTVNARHTRVTADGAAAFQDEHGEARVLQESGTPAVLAAIEEKADADRRKLAEKEVVGRKLLAEADETLKNLGMAFGRSAYRRVIRAAEGTEVAREAEQRLKDLSARIKARRDEIGPEQLKEEFAEQRFRYAETLVAKYNETRAYMDLIAADNYYGGTIADLGGSTKAVQKARARLAELRKVRAPDPVPPAGGR